MAYIDREIFINNELIPLVKRLDLCHPKQKKGVLMAIQKLNEEPTADVVEVKHGKWEECFEDWRKQIVGDECSACGFRHYGTSISHYHYCPNCGTKMDLETGKKIDEANFKDFFKNVTKLDPLPEYCKDKKIISVIVKIATKNANLTK